VSEHDEFLELAALHAVGALSEPERARFEAHLAQGCPECEAELASLGPAIDALADAVEPVEPGPELRRRVLAFAEPLAAAAASEPEARVVPLRRRAWLPLLAAAASIALAVVLGVQSIALRSQLDRARAQAADLERALASEQETVQRVRGELEQARTAQQVLTAQVEALEATTRVLTAPATRTVALAGQGPAAAARARAFLSPDTHTLILYAYDLPPLPEDRTYQAWVIPDKVPVPAGVFEPEQGGFARHEVSDVAGLDAPVTVAVTIEPRGGLPQPSGPIVLAGR
jgi:anti-sigma-K factor RskA